jgi:putative membrane protein
MMDLLSRYGTPVLAQVAEQLPVIDVGGPTLIRHLVAAVVFSLVGVVVLTCSFFLIARFSPFCIVKEIEEDQNVALAILVSSVILGLSIIIAAAILG